MTIDECILDCIHYTSTDLCKYEGIHWSKSQIEQLAEWLKELRELRVTVSELQCEMQATGALLNERDKETRNKAIDDFAEKLLSAFDETNIKEYGFYPENLIMQVAKQLKAGGENDNLRR